MGGWGDGPRPGEEEEEDDGVFYNGANLDDCSDASAPAPARARLNLGHGFLKSIVRNQNDRSSYERAWQERSDATDDSNKKEFGIGIAVLKDGE